MTEVARSRQKYHGMPADPRKPFIEALRGRSTMSVEVLTPARAVPAVGETGPAGWPAELSDSIGAGFPRRGTFHRGRQGKGARDPTSFGSGIWGGRREAGSRMAPRQYPRPPDGAARLSRPWNFRSCAPSLRSCRARCLTAPEPLTFPSYQPTVSFRASETATFAASISAGSAGG